MKVVVRVRPFNEREANSRVVVQVLDRQSLLFDPKEEEDEFFYQGTKQNFRDLRKKANKELRFNFNNVFDEAAENEEIYKCTTAEIVEDLMNGYNCSVFAYGPTGAGKTFTMLGNEEIPGITYMTMVGLYDLIETMKDKTFEVAATYIEVYNENLRDLLSTSNNLQIREDPRRGVLVAGISVHKPKNAEELLNLLRRGNLNRSQHSTDANAESSRSHAVFTVFVNRIDRSGKLNGDTRGKMSFIDLAGSERATAISKNKVPRLREGANINKSLLALGNCINALADNKNKNHVPYRDSKLTRLLKDSLGGNCKTIMIVAVSPSHLSYEDTYNTLKYADRAQCIKVDAKQNIRTMDKSLSEYIKLVSDLRQEIERLKSQLALKATPPAICSATEVFKVQPETEKIYTENTEFREAFTRICDEKLQLLQKFYHLKRQLLNSEFRISRNERRCTLLKFIALGTQPVPDSTIENLHNRFEALKVRTENTESQINELQKREKVIIDSHNLMEEDKVWVDLKKHEIKNESLKLENQNLARSVKELDNNSYINNRLLDAILPVFKRHYTLLMGYGKGSNDIVEDFEKVANLVYDYKDISWADQLSNPEETESCDNMSSSNFKLTSLEGIDLTLSSINSVGTCAITSSVPLKCTRALTFPTENKTGNLKSPISDSASDDLNSTFTKDEDSLKSIPPPVVSNRPIIAAKVRSPTSKSFQFKMQRSTSSSILKRPLSTSTNTLSRSESTSDLNIKKRKLTSLNTLMQNKSPFGPLKMNLLKMRPQRSHPYKVDKANRANIKNKESLVMDQVKALIPKQTLTSNMRTNKLPPSNPPRLQ